MARVTPALQRIGDLAQFPGEECDEALGCAALRKTESVGCPIGSPEWREDMERRTGVSLKPKK